MSSAAELKKLKVPELKALLQEKGLDTAGTKEVLVQRLLAAPSAPAEAEAPAENQGTAPAPAPQAEEAKPAPAKASGTTASAAAAAAPVAAAVPQRDGPAVEKDKLLARSARFGEAQPEALASTAAAKGGADAKSTPANGSKPQPAAKAEEDAKKAARAARFGTVDPMPARTGPVASSKLPEAERNRLSRMGMPVTAPGSTVAVKRSAATEEAEAEFQARKASRLARFAADAKAVV